MDDLLVVTSTRAVHVIEDQQQQGQRVSEEERDRELPQRNESENIVHNDVTAENGELYVSGYVLI